VDGSTLFLVLILFSVVQPALARRWLESRRMGTIRALEQSRGTRVITLIHRQETMGFLGIPLVRYIDIQDAEAVLRAIRMTEDDVPIDLVLHTPGGLVLAADQIAEALRQHTAPVTVFVPHYAMSGGTLIALAADHIVLDRAAVLGQVDPQLGDKPAAALVRLIGAKPVEHIDDATWIQADMAKRALEQIDETVRRLLDDRFDDEAKDAIVQALATGRHTHDHPLRFDELEPLGLPLSDDVPPAVFALMDLYPQATQPQARVDYIPVPYRNHEQGPRPR